MTKGMFSLVIDKQDGSEPATIFCGCADLLAEVGRQHHAAADNKPFLTLLDAEGRATHTMDQWALTWTPAPDQPQA